MACALHFRTRSETPSILRRTPPSLAAISRALPNARPLHRTETDLRPPFSRAPQMPAPPPHVADERLPARTSWGKVCSRYSSREEARFHVQDQPCHFARIRFRLMRERVFTGRAGPFGQEREILRAARREACARQHRQQARRVRGRKRFQKRALRLPERAKQLHRPLAHDRRVPRKRTWPHGAAGLVRPARCRFRGLAAHPEARRG